MRARTFPIFLFFAALFGVHFLVSPAFSQDLRLRNLIPDAIPNTIQNVFGSQNVGHAALPQDDYAALPGFGRQTGMTLPPLPLQTPLNPTIPAQSLEMTEHLTPAVYVDSVGYVPINDPSLSSWAEEADLTGIEHNPAVVMIPEYRLERQWESMPPDALLSLAAASREHNTDHAVTLSYPKSDPNLPIVVSAKRGWVKDTDQYIIHFLEGDCSIRQGNDSAQGPRGVVWVDKEKNAYYSTREVTVFLESDANELPVQVELYGDGSNPTKISDQKWNGRFYTLSTVPTLIMTPLPATEDDPPILQRALAMMSPEHAFIEQVQHVEAVRQNVAQPTDARYRKISVHAIGDRLANARYDVYNGNQDRGIAIITNGVNLVVEGVSGQDFVSGEVVDISAENVVIWTVSPQKLMPGSDVSMDENEDMEIYLEGNIIYRDATRTIEAQRMYYDVKNRIAYILEGHLKTPIVGLRGISGPIRIKAEILQQLGDGLFEAKNAMMTVSQLGEPSTSLRSRKMTLNQNVIGTGISGQLEPRHILVAENNYIAVGKVPVFYWPWMAADLNNPTYYIENLTYGNSTHFGHQVRTRWNPFQILNIRQPDWLRGDVSVNWYELRGIGHGVSFRYNPESFLGSTKLVEGTLSFWGINDQGTDRLGGRRRDVHFPHKYRYHLWWQHRQDIPSLWKFQGPWTVTAQLGKMSDRNFSSLYFPNAWTLEPNRSTGIELKKIEGNASLQLSIDWALDDFVTNANKLPELKHTKIGQSLLREHLTWYEQTRVGLIDFQTASAPYDWANDGRYFHYLPWELRPGSPTNAPPSTPGGLQPQTLDATFEYFSTRHELDAPFNLGALRVVPYALGEFAHWGKDRTDNDVQRWFGQGGVRLNLPLWKVNPNIASRALYVNGIAHKIDLDAEFSYAQADKSMENLIFTEGFDRWSVEDFRRRYSVTTYGGAIPLMYDPRYYALRAGMAGFVTAGSTEIADDLTLMRVGMTHRFQTKRGPVGRRHIIDWITLSAHLNYYPQAEHNFGKSVGLIDYDFLWHVGDRFSVYSSGLYDEGQNITRMGAVWQRPKRGSVSITMDKLDGMITRTYLSLGTSYTMSDKYRMSYSTSFNIRDTWEITGHNFSFTRTGEAFRILVGVVYSQPREEWSFNFGIEPVFMQGIAAKLQRQAMQMVNNFQ